MQKIPIDPLQSEDNKLMDFSIKKINPSKIRMKNINT
jgi:hypothetical protein